MGKLSAHDLEILTSEDTPKTKKRKKTVKKFKNKE